VFAGYELALVASEDLAIRRKVRLFMEEDGVLSLLQDYRATTPPLERRKGREEIWDAFIDDLDRSGQAGRLADVIVPAAVAGEPLAGKRFGDLNATDITELSRIGGTAGRRGDVVREIWANLKRRPRPGKRR
jgi:hypothetical protein